MLTDAVLVTMYAALAILVVITTASSAVHGIRRRLSKAYLGISVCLLGWLFVTFAYHIVTNVRLLEYLDNLTFVFMAFMPVILLMFVLRFYRGKQVIGLKTIVLLSAIPAVTTVISLIPPLNWLLRTNYTMIQVFPLHISDYDWNIWFYVHAVYSYLVLGASGIVVLRQYQRQPAEYKLPSALLFASLFVTVLSDLPLLGLPASLAIVDNTLVGVCISMVIVYFAIVNNPAIEFISFARKALYNNLDMPVYILDKQDFVLDMNQAARHMLETLGHASDVPPLAFQEISAAVSDAGGTFKSDDVEDDMGHILINVNGESIVLRQVRREFLDHKGGLLGSYIAMIDITRWSRMVDDLQYKAEVDPLTGIPNRRAYEQKLVELDTPENLPISVIVGDVNRLKQVNDTMGHKYGDLLLKTVAGFFKAACPEGGLPARIGGDEFVMLLPGLDSGAARAIMDDIHNRLEHNKTQFLGASIALGHVVKTEPEQDIRELIHQADQLMYSQKKYDRRNRGA